MGSKSIFAGRAIGDRRPSFDSVRWLSEARTRKPRSNYGRIAHRYVKLENVLINLGLRYTAIYGFFCISSRRRRDEKKEKKADVKRENSQSIPPLE